MTCMREVTELSKSANFGGGDNNFRADCNYVTNLHSREQPIYNEGLELIAKRAIYPHHKCRIKFLECALPFAAHIHDRNGEFEW